MTVTSVIYHIIKMMLTIWACETGERERKNQATEINTTVHEVFNSINDKKIK